MSVSVTVITPWVDCPEFADAYWDAIEAGAPEDVIIVDNGSHPPLHWSGIRFDENHGFHAACNAGLRAAKTDAVVFLNNDILMLSSDWLTKLRAELAPGRFVGHVEREAAHTRIGGVPHPYIDGWCIAGMREDFHTVGGWDETLEEPAYYGDNLLSLRAQQHGIDLHHHEVGLEHIRNGTSRNMPWRTQQAAEHNRAVWFNAVTAALAPT